MRPALFTFVLGATLFGIAGSSSAADTVYVPLGGANVILMIDADEDQVVGRIEGVTAAHGLAATPDGRRLIVGSYDERPRDGSPPVRPAGVSEDEHAAHHAADKRLATGASEVVSTVTVIRSKDRAVVRRVDVGGAVHHVAVSPDGRFAVLTQPNQDMVSVLDLDSYAVAATVRTGAMPNYAAFSPDGRTVFVSNAGDGEVAAVGTANWTVNRTYAVGSSPEHLVLSADGRSLYVNNVDDGTVSTIDLVAERVRATEPVGDTPHGVDLSNDGQTLFVSVLGDDIVLAIDLATGARRQIGLSPSPYHLANIGTRGKLYVSSAEAPKLWVIDQQTLSLIGEIDIGGKGHQMVRTGGS